MDLASLGAAQATGLDETGNAARNKLAKDLDTFLFLLTSQLKNQDPLSPMDSTEFTNQLVQFANVEQQIGVNEKLENQLALQGTSLTAQAVGYLGKELQAESNLLPLQDGNAKLTYQLSEKVESVVVTIRDQADRVVHSIVGETEAGTYTHTWDGTDDQGIQLPDGVYKVSVSSLDPEGEVGAPLTTVYGTATTMANDGSQILLGMGDVLVPMAQVIAVREPLSLDAGGA